MPIGSMELLIVLAITVCLAGIAVGAFVLIASLRRGQRESSDRIAVLEAEVQRLREDHDKP